MNTTSRLAAGADNDTATHADIDGAPAYPPGDPEVRTARVLVVEDDPGVAELLGRALAREGYEVDLADDGQDALACGLENEYAVILLDAMIPPPDGFTVIRQLRRAGCATPVIMITARDSLDDRVAGLDAGADDYLTKPFSIREVMARVYALYRRGARVPWVLQVGDLVLDPNRRRVRRGSMEIVLPELEFDLLHLLMSHPERPLTFGYIATHVWGPMSGDRDLAGVEFWVQRLRDRIDHPFDRNSLQNVGLDSYRITAEE